MPHASALDFGGNESDDGDRVYEATPEGGELSVSEVNDDPELIMNLPARCPEVGGAGTGVARVNSAGDSFRRRWLPLARPSS